MSTFAQRTGRPGSRRAQTSGPLRQVFALAVFGVAVAVAAGVGGLAASSASSVYDSLEQPPWAPPAWLFGPVWTVLYVLLAVAAWLVWREVGVDRAIGAWVAQLVLNAVWTPLFFGGDRYGLALVDIVLLLAAIVVTIALFRTRSRTAALLLLPYLAWVAFATTLNAGIVVLN